MWSASTFGFDAPECRERMGGNRRDQVHVSGHHDWQVGGRVAWSVGSSWENEVSNIAVTTLVSFTLNR